MTLPSLLLVALLLPTAAPFMPPAEEMRTDNVGAMTSEGLVALLENDGDSADLEVAVFRGETLVERRAVFSPGKSETRVEFPLARDIYRVEVSVTTGVFVATVTSDADTRLCPGPFQVYVPHEGGFLWGVSERRGCLVVPDDVRALLAEARAGTRGVAGGASISIPLPRVGDRGFLSRAPSPAAWDDARPIRFAWTEGEAPDAFGRVVAASILSHDGGASNCGAVVSLDDTPVAANEQGAKFESATFAAGRIAPLATSSPGCRAELMVGTGGASTGGETFHVREYGGSSSLACALRHPLQGASFDPGSAPAPLCSALAEAAWAAGSPREERGFLVVPVYGVVETLERVDVVRYLLADGVAYPLEVVRASWTSQPSQATFALRLDALTSDGPALFSGSTIPPTAPGDAPLVRVDPLRGPEGSTPRAFPLAVAADAALADPTLGDLAALVARGGHLAGAVFRARDDAATGLEWTLLYVDDAAGQQIVSCTRPAPPAALSPPSTLFLPASRCRGVEPDPVAVAALGAPAKGWTSAGLPARGASLDLALERWRIEDPARADAEPDAALYRAWMTPEQASFVEVGRLGATGMRAASLDEASAVLSYARVDLASGATRIGVLGQRDVATLAGILAEVRPEGGLLAPERATPAQAPRPGMLVGSGVAAGLLVLLVLLALLAKAGYLTFFTRLLRPTLLEQELRASIHQLVGERPGVHANEVAEHLARGHGVIDYHLDVLVREGYVTCLRSGGMKHYFVTGRFHTDEMRALAALRRGQAEKLYRIIEANPGLHMQELAEIAGLSPGYVSKEVRRLQEVGLVDTTQVGRAIRLHALDR